MGVNNNDIEGAFGRFIEKVVTRLHENIVYALSELGNKCVKRARENHPLDWKDQTGNLRSSIGYAVMNDGKAIIRSAFQAVAGKTGSGEEGKQAGERMIDEIANKYSETYALVVVAAMDYASYVEAHENRDVLASAEIYARQEVEKVVNTAIEATVEYANKLEIK